MSEDLCKTHGAISWSELLTTDVDGAKRFYQSLFGWTLEDDPMGGEAAGMTYTVAKVAGKECAGIMRIPPEAEGMPPCWGLYVTVDDVDAAAAKTTEIGGKVLMPPRDIPKVGRFAVIQDPQGAYISIITLNVES